MSIADNLRAAAAAVETYLIDHVSKSALRREDANFRVAASISLQARAIVDAVELNICKRVENIIASDEVLFELDDDYRVAIARLRKVNDEFLGAAREIASLSEEVAEYSRAHPFARILGYAKNARKDLYEQMSVRSSELLNKRDHLIGITGCITEAIKYGDILKYERERKPASYNAEKFDFGFLKTYGRREPERHHVKIGGVEHQYLVHHYL